MMSRTTAALLAVGLAAGLTVAGCATGPPERPAAGNAPVNAPVNTAMNAPVLVDASPGGVVVLDPVAESFFGLDRTGRQIWRDRTAFHSGAEPVCLARCPDVVFSGTWSPAGPDPEPWRPTPAGPRAFAESASSVRRVLTARAPSDAVLAEGPAVGAGRLRLTRPAGPPELVPVRDAAGVAWSEDPDGTTALAVTSDEVLWFGHDRRGWRRLAGTRPAGGAWGACVANGGELAVLVGDAPRLVLRRHRTVPITTDLDLAGECAAGRESAALIARWKDEHGRAFTAVRGVDATGARTWARDVRDEAQVRADPSGARFVVVHGGGAEVLDRAGRTLARYAGVSSAAYTADGRLVLLRPDRTLQWS